MKINYLEIILGALLNIILARVWYGVLFKKTWRLLTNRTEDEKPTRVQIRYSVLFALMMSFGVNIMVNLLYIRNIWFGLIVGLILGILCIAPIILSEWIWDKKSSQLVLLNAGFYVVYFILTILVFVAIG